MARRFLLIDRLVPLAMRVREQWESGTLSFPPTDVFNRDWMLKAAMDALEDASLTCCRDNPLYISQTEKWRANVLLESPFQPRFPGDHLADGSFRAGAVIAGFSPEGGPGGSLRLARNCRRFSVILPILFEDPLPGAQPFPWFHPVARAAACMAHTIQVSGLRPDSIPDLHISLLGPEDMPLSKGVRDLVTPEAVHGSISSRVNCYREEGEESADRLYQWLHEIYGPFARRLRIHLQAWPSELNDHMTGKSEKLLWFYEGCLFFNSPDGSRPARAFPANPRGMPRTNGLS